jgi:hypothetical protein
MAGNESGRSEPRRRDSSANRDGQKSLEQSDPQARAHVDQRSETLAERDRHHAGARNEGSGRVGSSSSSEARR